MFGILKRRPVAKEWLPTLQFRVLRQQTTVGRLLGGPAEQIFGGVKTETETLQQLWREIPCEIEIGSVLRLITTDQLHEQDKPHFREEWRDVPHITEQRS